jgi:hypothetical protein
MYRLIIEHIIRRILQEEEFTNLGTGAFRGRPGRVNTFLNKLGHKKGVNPEFTLKDGNTVSFTDAKIIKSSPTVGSGDEKKPKVEFIFSEDPAEFGTQLEKLGRGDKLSLTGSDGKTYKVSDIAKTTELGGLGKGAQRGAKSEKTQATTIKGALENGPIDLKIIDVTRNEHTLKDVSDFISAGKNTKADFKFVTAEGDVYVQTKDESHQQLEGVVRSNFARDPEGHELIKELGRKTKEAISGGRLTKPVIVPIEDERLQRLAVYGTADETVPSNPSAVTMYFIGDVKIENNTLTANKIYYYPYVPKNDPPVLAATYRGGRNQRMPGEKESLTDVRLGVYFQSTISSAK